MKKTVLFALPLVALMLAVACKKQEAAVETAAPAATEQVATPAAAPAATPVAAPAATPVAPAKATEKKGK